MLPTDRLRLTQLRLPLEHQPGELTAKIASTLRVSEGALGHVEIFRRAVDARDKSRILWVYTVDVEVADAEKLCKRAPKSARVSVTPDMTYRHVARAPEAEGGAVRRPVVIGAGPCGIFATLVLAEMGFRPLLLERGKRVRERTRDTFGLWRGRKLDPESNVQFGEGGAGTFSDGKLHSQIKDRKHHGRKVIQEFITAGASPEILYVSKPHIGTFRLVGIVERLRAKIESLGGEICFEERVSDFEIADGAMKALHRKDGGRVEASQVILAVGHSARDTFECLKARGVRIEPKPFSIGFRVEHPQSLIDRCRYGDFAGNSRLGAADYKLVHHAANGRSVYSFCMCPGGTVVAATSEEGCVVTNGMSQYSRSARNANSGIVVGVTPKDYPGSPLAGVEFQRRWEARAFELGGGNYDAPGQLVGDFLAGRSSTRLGSVLPSYTPGVRLGDLSTSLPEYAITAIREALPAFDRTIPGFAMSDALLTGVESRTSSPLRIVRDEIFQSVNTRGLYPAGEGAGYAGGILSAAIDGIKVAEAVALAIVAAGRDIQASLGTQYGDRQSHSLSQEAE